MRTCKIENWLKFKYFPILSTKKIFLFNVLLILFGNYSFSQSSSNNYGWNNRISFFVGAGTSMITDEVREIPVIDKTTNFVIIEDAGKIKPNASMGIVYTPWVFNVKRKIKYIDSNGEEQVKFKFEHEPKHFSIALFINPISLTAANSNLSNTIDLGYGLGWRSDNFAIFATMEFFRLKQPRNYFVKTYLENDKQYVIGGEIQTTIDINDTSIFKNQVMTAFGLKLAYTFDIVNNYSREVAANE